MNRSQLPELLKSGPKLTDIADALKMSRPTLYRHIDYYVAGEDEKVNSHLKGYFDKVMMNKFATVEEAQKEIDQIRFFVISENEKKHEDFELARDSFMEESHEFRYRRSSMPAKERNEKEDDLDRKYEVLKKQAAELGIKPDQMMVDDFSENLELKWNEGHIKSTACSDYPDIIVFIDTDFERCKNVTAELIVEISGKDFVCARVNPEEGMRYAKLPMVGSGATRKYRLKWNEGDHVRYTPVYPIE